MLTNGRHQEDGIQFVLQREDQTFCKELSARLAQATRAPHTEDEGTSMAFGGLVADAMGLGKTLTTLVSILRSTERASDFGYFDYEVQSVGMGLLPTKATLVIVPSARKLS